MRCDDAVRFAFRYKLSYSINHLFNQISEHAGTVRFVGNTFIESRLCGENGCYYRKGDVINDDIVMVIIMTKVIVHDNYVKVFIYLNAFVLDFNLNYMTFVILMIPKETALQLPFLPLFV